MRRLMFRIAALFLTIVIGSGRAAESASDPNPVLRATLGNGLRVVIVPSRLAHVVTTDLNYLAGSNDAPDGFPGTAHALEHMMFRGSDGLDKDQLAELGALMGGHYNANTTETVTKYTYTVPAGDLDLVLRIEALRMRGLSLNEADWDKERGAIEQEVSSDLSNPFYNFMAQVQGILFEHTPYEHDALGSRPSFDKTDSAMLRRFYETWYAPNNAILVIAGDVRAEDALAQVKAGFGEIPGRTLPAHRAIVPAPVQPRTLELETNFQVGLVAIGYRMPGLNQRDFAAADILGDVLSSERGTLYGLVPQGKALVAQFTYLPKADVGVGLAVGAFPAGTDPAPLLADMRTILADTVHNGVSPALVAASKRLELAQLALRSNSIDGLAENWSRALAVQGAESPDDLARAYEAVTVDDVNRMALLLLDPNHAVTAILTPHDSGRPAAGSGFGGGESFAVSPDHPVTLPPWAEAAWTIPSEPDRGESASVTTLPNGLRLITIPQHVSPTVEVHGRVRHQPATQEPPGKEGVSDLMEALFPYGTESHDRLAYREAVDDLAAEVNAGTNFSLRVLTPAFEAGMGLVAENLLHPAFPDDAFKVLRTQLAQSAAGRMRTPDHKSHRAMIQAIVPNGDPATRQATPESIMALQPEDVRAFYAASIRPDLTTIVVIGDVTPDQTRQVVSRVFGEWRASGPAPSIDPPPVGPNKSSHTFVPDDSAQQDSVAMAETVGLLASGPDRYTLTLGNTILGDGFSSRLYQDLRVRSGLVYAVGASLQWGPTRTYYHLWYGSDTGNVDTARGLILRDLRDMQTAPVSGTELTRAKAGLLRRMTIERANFDAIAGKYLRQADLGLPLDEDEVAARRYRAITAADIQQAFATWVRPDDFAQVVKGPPR